MTGVYVATHAAIMVFIHGLKVVVFAFLGFQFFTYLPLMVSMVTADFWELIGFKLLNMMNEEVFKRVFQIMLIISQFGFYGRCRRAGYI